MHLATKGMGGRCSPGEFLSRWQGLAEALRWSLRAPKWGLQLVSDVAGGRRVPWTLQGGSGEVRRGS